MKLLVIIPSLERGGAEEYALTLIKAARQQSMEVHTGLYIHPQISSLIDDLNKIKVTVHPILIGGKKTPMFWKHILRMFSTFILIVKIKPDNIFVTIPGTIMGLGILTACAIKGIPTVATFQLVPFHEHLLKPIIQLYQWCKSRNQRWIGTSRNNIKLLSESFHMRTSKFEYIPNGVELRPNIKSFQEKLEYKSRICKELNIPIDSRLLLTTGALRKQKGHTYLVSIIPDIIHQFKNVHFVWLGQGDEEENLRNQVSKLNIIAHVHILGFKNNVIDYLQAADLFVFPTSYEGQPFSLLEAMSVGLPIVSTDVSGIQEIITHNSTGILCPKENSHALKEAVTHALTYPDEMDKMAQQGFKKVKEFSKENMIAKTLNLITNDDIPTNSHKTILIATDKRFWMLSQGSAERIKALLEALSKADLKIHLYFTGFLWKKDVAALTQKYPDVALHQPSFRSNLIQAINMKLNNARTILSSKEKRLKDFYLRSNRDHFQKLCHKIQPSFVLIEYIRLAHFVLGLKGKSETLPITMIDTHDVMHRRCQIFHQYGIKHWINITKEEEAGALNLFDIVIAIQNQDKQIFQEFLSDTKVITTGHSVPIQMPLSNTHTHKKVNIAISYIATDSPPNRHAIKNFLDHVWPSLYTQHSDKISLSIVGDICRSIQENLYGGIKLLNFQKDLTPIYKESDIIINPVYIGGGLKIKNVEALCHARPLITTSIGAEGMEEGIGTAFLVCDTYTDMTTQLSRLIENVALRHELSQEAHKFSKNNFTPEYAYKELCDILQIS